MALCVLFHLLSLTCPCWTVSTAYVRSTILVLIAHCRNRQFVNILKNVVMYTLLMHTDFSVVLVNYNQIWGILLLVRITITKL